MLFCLVHLNICFYLQKVNKTGEVIELKMDKSQRMSNEIFKKEGRRRSRKRRGRWGRGKSGGGGGGGVGFECSHWCMHTTHLGMN